jgi:hypothetical protein
MVSYGGSEFTFLKITVLWLSQTVCQSLVVDKAAFYQNMTSLSTKN